MNDDDLDPGWNADKSWVGYSEEDRIKAAREFLRDLFRSATIPDDGLGPKDNGLGQWIANSADLLIEDGLTDWARLVYDAKQDAKTFDVLTECAARLCLDGKGMPPSLAAWTGDALRGKAKRPQQHGGHLGTLYLRNAWLVHAVEFVAKFADLDPTRNEATTGVTSACDLVSQVAWEFGTHVDFQTVKQLWKCRGKRYHL